MSTKIPRVTQPGMKRGDSFLPRMIGRLSALGEPVQVFKARMELRTVTGDLIYRWATDDAPATATITGEGSNEVNIAEVAPEVTATWPPGNHVYDLEVWLAADGSKITILEGTQEIQKGITQND